MRISIIPVLILLLLLLTGCETVNTKVSNFMGGEDNAKPPTPLRDFPQKLTVKKLWDESIGDGTDKQYLKLTPAFSGNRIYVANSDGDVKALDQSNGKVIWSKDVDARISGGPGTGENLVMLGTSEAEVITLLAETGEILWKRRVSSEVLAAPQVADGIVIARSIDGKIFGLKADSGDRLWIYDQTVPTLSLRGTSAPVIANGMVIAGFDEGRLVAIEQQTGKQVWEVRIALGSGRSELDRMVDIDSEPIIIDDVVYVATFQGRVAALSLGTGRIIWTRDIPSYAGIYADETAVYITDDDSNVWSLDRFNGNSIWKQEDLQSRAVTGPTRINDSIVVGDLEGYLHWLDSNTGEIVGRAKLSGSKIIVPPVAVNESVYAYASDGVLGAFNQVHNQNYVAPVIAEEVPVETEETMEADDESDDSGDDITAESGNESGNKEERSFFGRVLDIFSGDQEDE